MSRRHTSIALAAVLLAALLPAGTVRGQQEEDPVAKRHQPDQPAAPAAQPTAPASQPTTAPAAGGDATPMQALRSWTAACDRGDIATAMKYCYTAEDPKGHVWFAKTLCQLESDVYKLRQTSVKQLGPEADAAVAHAFDLYLPTEVTETKKDRGNPNKAFIHYKGARSTLPMINKDGHWKIDFNELASRFGMHFDQGVGSYELRQNAAVEVNKAILDHPATTVDKLVAECFRRTYERR